MFSPVFERNAQPIIKALTPLLQDFDDGTALEIGSGTGQHIAAFSRAFKRIHWTPSEPDPRHRTSIDAWRRYTGAPAAPAIALDAAAHWQGLEAVRALVPLRLVLSLNVIHISPLATLNGILAGAGETLAEKGLLIFYGPFKEAGAHSADSNAAFDARLRARNAAWGVRDADALTDSAAKHGLRRLALLTMPANNRLLVLQKP